METIGVVCHDAGGAEVISSWRPPPPTCPLPWFSRADRLAQQRQPPPPSYPPPQHDRLQQDSTGATGSSEEHIGSSIPEQPPPTRQNDLAPNPRWLGSPLGPHHTALDQHPHLEAEGGEQTDVADVACLPHSVQVRHVQGISHVVSVF